MRKTKSLKIKDLTNRINSIEDHFLKNEKETMESLPEEIVIDDKIPELLQTSDQEMENNVAETQVNCIDCDFVTNSEHSLKDHKAEKHKLKLNCEVCDFKAQTKNVLEIHLVTCEIYKCGKCEYKSRRLSSVKTHILKQHGKGDHTLNHLKMDRTNPNEGCNTFHSLNNL